MKVLFLVEDFSLAQEPLGIMYLSSALKSAGHETEALNTDACRETVIDEIARRAPGLIAFSSTSGLHRSHIELANRIKTAMNVPIIMGNAHATLFPEILEQETSLDFLCLGEGEEAIVELVDALEKKTDPTGIRNIWAKIDGKIYKNPIRPFRSDLDALPFPDRGLVSHLNPAYLVHGTSHVVTGRGCPYDCTYCFNHILREMTEGKYVRRRSVDNVIREIKEVVALNRSQMIDIQDDTFILDKKWLLEFAPRFRNEIGLPYLCHVRANLMTEEIAKILADSGCVTVCIGIEAGNDRLRNEILHRNLSKEQIYESCRLLNKYGIDIISQNVVGIPYETLDTLWETLEINRKCRPKIVVISSFEPYPKQVLTQTAMDAGFFDGNFDKLRTSYYNLDRFMLDLPDRENLEHLALLGNLTIDSRLVWWIVRLLLLLPRKSRMLSKALRWLGHRHAGIRRRLHCPDSRWQSLSRYWGRKPSGTRVQESETCGCS
jgi:anaerobic magnesium-protoporphyrin IX monomethyl ester cyclase